MPHNRTSTASPGMPPAHQWPLHHTHRCQPHPHQDPQCRHPKRLWRQPQGQRRCWGWARATHLPPRCPQADRTRPLASAGIAPAPPAPAGLSPGAGRGCHTNQSPPGGHRRTGWVSFCQLWPCRGRAKGYLRQLTSTHRVHQNGIDTAATQSQQKPPTCPTTVVATHLLITVAAATEPYGVHRDLCQTAGGVVVIVRDPKRGSVGACGGQH
jgi:hypothetical protein